MDSEPFRETCVGQLLDDFLDQHFSKKMDLGRVLRGVYQVRKGSYLDPLVMRFSPKFGFVVDWKFLLCVHVYKTLFFFEGITSVLKNNLIL